MHPKTLYSEPPNHPMYLVAVLTLIVFVSLSIASNSYQRPSLRTTVVFAILLAVSYYVSSLIIAGLYRTLILNDKEITFGSVLGRRVIPYSSIKKVESGHHRYEPVPVFMTKSGSETTIRMGLVGTAEPLHYREDKPGIMISLKNGKSLVFTPKDVEPVLRMIKSRLK